MAPVPTRDTGNRSILNFFKTRCVDNNEPADEIVVASRQSSSVETRVRATNTSPSTQKSSQFSSTPQAGKRGRPRKIVSSPASNNAQNKYPPRKRSRLEETGSERQLCGQIGNPSQSLDFKDSPLELNICHLDEKTADVTPIAYSLHHAPSAETPCSRVALDLNVSSFPEKSRSSVSMAAPAPKSREHDIQPSRLYSATASRSFRQQPVEQSVANDGTIKPSQFTGPPPVSSISTLMSVPSNSGATNDPLPSSSSNRRITKNGLKGVANSESDGSSSDSEGLRPLSSFRRSGLLTADANKRRKLSSPTGGVHCVSRDPARAKESQLSNNAIPRSPPRLKLKNNLADLVARHERWQNSEAKIARLEKAAVVAKQYAEESRKQREAGMNATLDGNDLLATAGSDDDQQERMLMALQRTEALQDHQHYNFFLDERPLRPQSPFPIEALPDAPWSKVYRDKTARVQACLSGFAAELATHYPPPMAVTGWIATQLLYERDADLCEAYVEILRASSAHQISISHTTASLSSIYKTRSFFENTWKEQVSKKLPPGLTYFLRVAQCFAPAIDSVVSDALPDKTCAAFLDMALMNVDENVKKDLNLSMTIARCIETMLDALPEESFCRMVPVAVAEFFAPSELPMRICCRAISSLPAGTERANELRRGLALECFATDEDRKHPGTRDWAKSILDTMKVRLEFQVTESTDYVLLLELILVLDIAISAGWANHADIMPGKPTGPWGRPPSPKPTEKLHNTQIDGICRRLKFIQSKIKDSGASHLRRTEAKTAIERLIVRLEHTVRARPKPKKSVFEDGDGVSHRTTFRQATFDGTKFGGIPEQAQRSKTTSAVPPGQPHLDEHDEVEMIPVDTVS